MVELELSVFDRGPEANNVIRSLLNEFERKERIRVAVEFTPFRGGWTQLVNVALHHFGPDVSEAGNTWIQDFVRMNAVEPFTPADVRQLGGENSFLKLNWESGMGYGGATGSRTLWAIPWSADVRAVIYRRDWVQKAGLDETTAFSTPQDLENTLQKLAETGVEIPLAVPTLRSRVTIHNMASFVWGAGGQFFSPDGKELLLNDPKTRQGMREYFGLGRFIPSAAHEAEDGVPEQLFYEGRVGVLMTGYWALRDVAGFPDIQKNTGVAQIPGLPFVGGLHLLMWKHTRKPKEVVRLINFLTGNEISEQLFPMLGLPARLESLEKPPFSTDVNYKTLVDISKKGYTLSSQHLWGLVESRLTDIVPLIWKEILTTPHADIDAILDKFIEPLSRRLTGALSSLNQ